MALISDAALIWSAPLTLATDEIWQTRKGSVYVTTTNDPDDEDGLALHETHAVRLPQGAVVQYRKTGETEALIVREAV